MHILEAYQPVLEDTGEDFPPLWEYRGLLMSSDPVATDLIGLRILAAKQAETRQNGEVDAASAQAALQYLQAAGSDRFRAGQSDPEAITLQVIGTTKDILIGTASGWKPDPRVPQIGFVQRELQRPAVTPHHDAHVAIAQRQTAYPQVLVCRLAHPGGFYSPPGVLAQRFIR